MEGDPCCAASSQRLPTISIHTLRVEGDGGYMVKNKWHYKFQSTPSAWRVTPKAKRILAVCEISIHTLRVEGDRTAYLRSRQARISIHTLRVEGDDALNNLNSKNYISIHTLRVEGDALDAVWRCPSFLFQSTPSAWRVTSTIFLCGHLDEHFNPHPPRGG